MVTHRKFIQSGEVLLLEARSRHGIIYIEEEMVSAGYETAADAIKGRDDFIRAMRLDLSTIKGEDVTEECAAAWLDSWTGTPDDDVPAFVENSEAFEAWCEEYRTENGFDPRREYGTYNAVGGRVA